MIRYWCAIGTIGTLTPASAATSGVYIPHAATTVSASIGAVVGDDAGRPGPRRRRGRSTRTSGLDGDAAVAWRRRATRTSGRSGRGSRRSAATPPPSTPVGSISGKRSWASPGRHQLHREPERLGPPVLAAQLLHARFGRRDAAASRPRASRAIDRSPPPRPRAAGRRRRCASSSGSAAALDRSWPTRPGRVERAAARRLGPLEHQHVGAAAPRRGATRCTRRRRRRRRSRPGLGLHARSATRVAAASTSS